MSKQAGGTDSVELTSSEGEGRVSRAISARFRSLLMEWASEHRRDFPWRQRRGPYEVLVSEFMLHRTQAKQVVPVFERFTCLYPTLANLGCATDSELEDVLTPLGLHWRIRGMIEALRLLLEEYGEVPADYDKLTQIRNIGPYIAGATVCFSHGKPVTLIDTNTVRVVGRAFGLDLRGEARRRRSVVAAIEAVTDRKDPRAFYYGLIDFAHEVCTPKAPKCHGCPLLELSCAFGQSLLSAERVENSSELHPAP